MSLAIPGLKPNYDVRAKVRIGEKKVSAKGKEYPSATDYFLCDDEEFQRLYPGKPKELRILLPFAAPADAFSTGLEAWKGKVLSCYSKGEGDPPLAYRKTGIGGLPLEGETIRGEPMGKGKERTPITCRFRECPVFKARDCKPMGRIQFFLEGGRNDAVLQVDTKAWNSIEGIEATLASASSKGDLRGRVFILSVTIHKKGNQNFPVLSLREADVLVKDENDLKIADALVQLRKHHDARVSGVIEHDEDVRLALVDALELTNPGWRGNDEFTARIREIGVVTAAHGLLATYDL